MYIFNTKVMDRDYTKLDVPLGEFKSIDQYSLPSEFYGGNVTHIGDVKDSPFKLLLNNGDDHMKVVDVAADSLEAIDAMCLKNYAKSKGYEFPWKCTKDDIIALLDEKVLKV